MMHLMHRILERRRTYSAALALAATASFLMLSVAANAATIVVKSTAELEAAVATANGNAQANTIELASGSYLPGKSLVLTDTSGTQTIAGPAGTVGVATASATLGGGNVAPVSGVSEQEFFAVKAGVTLVLKHVILTTAGGGGSPAIDDLGTLDVENATIDGNNGTQILVETGATAHLTNSTLADGHELGLADEGAATLLNVTDVKNAGGGVGGSGALTLTNSIVALNTGAQCGTETITNHHSLSSDATCGGEAQFQNKTPLLQSLLQNDGGSTTVYSEKAGSPTIDAGETSACPTTDQRGYPRPDAFGGSAPCDIGADEYSAETPSIKVPAEIVTPATSSSGATVTYAVEATDAGSLVKTLACAPASGSTFKAGTTKVTCNAADGHENKSAASFNVKVTTPKHLLTVTVSGEGTVTSTPAGIECGQGHTTCSAEFEEVPVSLNPAPATGFTVAWGGACSGTGSCSFNPMTAAESVTATFSSGPVNTGVPVVSGTPYNGQTLKTTNGTWTGSPTSFTYQWEDCNSSGASCTSIAGATTAEYTLTSADIEHTIRVVVIASNSSGASLPAESAPTAGVTASVAPTVEGKVPFTQTLEAACTHVELGNLLPGVAATYQKTCLLNATSTAAASALTAEDPSAEHTGHLVQGSYFLTEPLNVEATTTETEGSPSSAGKKALTSKSTLMSFANPFSKDGMTATFYQAIASKEGLHTGTYAKTIVLTLSTTTP